MLTELRWLGAFLVCAVLGVACTVTSDDEVDPTGDGAGGGGGGDGDGGDAGGGDGGGGGAAGGFFTGPIAAACTEELAWCAQAEVDAVLSCLDVDRVPYTITTHLEGTTDNVGCLVDEGSTDLGLTVATPQSSADDAVHEVRFWLRGYSGPGTYQLETDTAAGDFRNMGLYLQGAPAGSAAVADEDTAWAAAGWCEPIPCTAVVHDGSEPIPQDPGGVHAFHVRVEISCEAGAEFRANQGGDCDLPENRCTLDGTATLRFDVQCSN